MSQNTGIIQKDKPSGSSLSSGRYVHKEDKKMRQMKMIVALVLIVISTAAGGIIDTTNVIRPHSNSKALEFGMYGLLNFRGYLGNTFALKSFTSPNRARRYILDLSTHGSNESGEMEKYQYRTIIGDSLMIDTTYEDLSSEENRITLSLAVQWIRYTDNYGNLSLLYGIGPIFGFSVNDGVNSRDPRAILPYTYSYDRKTATKAIYTGLVPVVGVEWFLHKNLSFHAEYSATIKMGWRSTDDSNHNGSTYNWVEYDSHTEGIYYEIRNNANAGVSFYFR